ncbi:MAG: glycosyltransferase family 2 protein [Deltaproteobacteria bacterium]|nr:glycosyltransferase family 2 protein [Deltaproteobacteria bacterium]
MNIFGMVTTKKSESYTAPALESFFKNTKLEAKDRFLLIDNDNSYEPQASYPQLEIIKNETPQSFATNGNTLIDVALLESANLFFMNNDLIFTPGWSEPIRNCSDSICTPLSNAEVQYALGVSVVANQNNVSTYVTNRHMQLSEYEGHQYDVAAIGAAHARTSKGSLPVLYFPFFCVYIPLSVMQQIGHFDTRFGIAGGEDFDYCLRACLAGTTLSYKLSSWIVHFGGKSTWSAEEQVAKTEREQKLLEEFEKKWGREIFELVLLEKAEILKANADESKQHTGEYFTGALKKILGGRQIETKL